MIVCVLQTINIHCYIWSPLLWITNTTIHSSVIHSIVHSFIQVVCVYSMCVCVCAWMSVLIAVVLLCIWLEWKGSEPRFKLSLKWTQLTSLMSLSAFLKRPEKCLYTFVYVQVCVLPCLCVRNCMCAWILLLKELSVLKVSSWTHWTR